MHAIAPLLLLAACQDPADSAAPRRFTVVALPDTQEYADDHPELFDQQTQWVADQAEALNIAFVTHLGDVVDNGPNERQWANARASLDILEGAGVPYGIAMGNHDHMYSDSEYEYPADVDNACSDTYTDIDCAAEHYLRYAGPSFFEGEAWFGGSSASGQSSYAGFQLWDHTWLFLHLAVDVPSQELAWAQQVLDDNPGALVHVSTHRYLYDGRVVDLMPSLLHVLLPGRYNALIYELGDPPYYSDSTLAEDLFEGFVAANPNIYMVQCGHVDAEYRQVSQNIVGLPVHELLTDFQSYHEQGGTGWLKQLDYDLDAGTIEVSTYSPYLERYRENGEGLDASLELLNDALNALGPYLEDYGLDPKELEAQLDCWSNTEEGRQEYYEAAYGDGSRDSAFTLELDFMAYEVAGGALAR